MQYEKDKNAFNDNFRDVVFGGVLYGLGIGKSFATGTSTGETDIDGRIIQKKILEIDDKAFIVFSESQRIKGNGFYLYK